MDGLEKIAEQIHNDAAARAAELTAEGEAQARAIAAEAAEECAQLKARLLAQAEEEAASVQRLAVSAAQLEGKKRLLTKKQELISEVIEEARKALLALPEEEYFEMILKLAEGCALPKAGEIAFSAGDLARLPAGFEEALNKELAAKGGSLKVSGQAREIDGGFVLVYGGIEENCSITALFDAKREALQDLVHKVLFSCADAHSGE